ncbi:Ral GTPase-activating protein subunit alpha-2 [Quaeritorhiza haematococci]|nr:Ral GTPase-activating protein subunit alpha-2 [Quaeritorhiza haematococci]
MILQSFICTGNVFGQQTADSIESMSAAASANTPGTENSTSSSSPLDAGLTAELSRLVEQIPTSRPQSIAADRNNGVGGEMFAVAEEDTSDLGGSGTSTGPISVPPTSAASIVRSTSNLASKLRPSPSKRQLIPHKSSTTAMLGQATILQPGGTVSRTTSFQRMPLGTSMLIPSVPGSFPVGSMTVPVFEYFSQIISTNGDLCVADLKLQVKETLLSLVVEEKSPSRYEKNPETHGMLLSAVTLMAFDEMLTNPSPVKEIVDDCINALLDHLTLSSLKVISSATAGLTLFAQNIPRLKYLDQNTLQSVIEKMVGALTEQLMFPPDTISKETRVISNPKIARLVFDVIEHALNDDDSSIATTMAKSSGPRLQKNASHNSDLLSTSMNAGGSKGNRGFTNIMGGGGSSNADSPGAAPPLGMDRKSAHNSGFFLSPAVTNGVHDLLPMSWVQSNHQTYVSPGDTLADELEITAKDCDLVKEAAENVLVHILHHVNHFAPPFGAATMSSLIADPAMSDDKENEHYLYFTYNDTHLITVVELPGDTPWCSRDVEIEYHSEQQNYLGMMQELNLESPTAIESQPRIIHPDTVTYTRQPDELPIFNEQTGVGNVDMLDELLQHIATAHPDCLLRENVPLNVPADIPAHRQEAVVNTGGYLQRQCDYEQKYRELFISDLGANRITETDSQEEKAVSTDDHLAASTPLSAMDSLKENATTEAERASAKRKSKSEGSIQLPFTTEEDRTAQDAETGQKKSDKAPLMADSTMILAYLQSSGESEDRENMGSTRSLAEDNPSNRNAASLGVSPSNRSPINERQTGNGDEAAPLSKGIRRRMTKVASDTMVPTKSYISLKPSKANKSLPPYQRSRLWLSHFGFLNFDGLKDNSFHLLAKTSALYRDIKCLDRKYGRETIKVGLIYVAAGQEDQISIFKNESGSLEYEEFVSSLGWEIDLATHPGYTGGLEKNQANGCVATYFCTSTLEMVFHDVTKMPTDPTDPKQLKKKRHIGNDHVHIIWNEHTRDYRKNTIGGDFGNVQIVVSPMMNGLYAIEIHRDSKVPTFGPLQNRMVVSRPTLGPLVRLTAIYAARASLVLQNQHHHTPASSFTKPPTSEKPGKTSSAPSPTPPSGTSSLFRPAYSQRAADIQYITNRHQVSKWTYERFMESVFMTGEQGIIGSGLPNSLPNSAQGDQPPPTAQQQQQEPLQDETVVETVVPSQAENESSQPEQESEQQPLPESGQLPKLDSDPTSTASSADSVKQEVVSTTVTPVTAREGAPTASSSSLDPGAGAVEATEVSDGDLVANDDEDEDEYKETAMAEDDAEERRDLNTEEDGDYMVSSSSLSLAEDEGVGRTDERSSMGL